MARCTVPLPQFNWVVSSVIVGAWFQSFKWFRIAAKTSSLFGAPSGRLARTCCLPFLGCSLELPALLRAARSANKALYRREKLRIRWPKLFALLALLFFH